MESMSETGTEEITFMSDYWLCMYSNYVCTTIRYNRYVPI